MGDSAHQCINASSSSSVPRATTAPLCCRRRFVWTKARDERLREFNPKHLKYGAIARDLGCSNPIVQKRVLHLGLQRPTVQGLHVTHVVSSLAELVPLASLGQC